VTNVLDITGLRKAYRSPDGEITPVIDVPHFVVAEGEAVGIRGASGSGKTTFLNLIAGILQPDAGHIRLGGQDLSTLSESARDRLRARTVGYIYQSFNLLQGYTALENVMVGMLFAGGVNGARATALLQRVGLAHRMNYRPSQLSIGQQQRVAVARALANRPPLVLADEPTGNLDTAHAAEALALIREICADEGAALLLVSHDPSILGTFSRIEDLTPRNDAATTMHATTT